jgi:hypothetical protein
MKRSVQQALSSYRQASVPMIRLVRFCPTVASCLGRIALTMRPLGRGAYNPLGKEQAKSALRLSWE